jgi:endonuclease-8
VPEGDTIHRIARSLHAALAGTRVRRLELRGRSGPRAERPRSGATVTGVEARGKHLLITFDDGVVLHTHLGMHGSWHLYRRADRWKRPGTQARVILEVDGGTTAVCFAPSLVETTRGAQRPRLVDDLGPDLCRDDPDLDDALARLARLDPATELGVALLDQRVAAGIGNVYKSEVCFACRVDPFTPVGALDVQLRRALLETASRLLRANLTTARRRTVDGGLAVYGRARRPCRRCGTPIRTRRQGEGARSTYWCASCQPAPRVATSRRSESTPTTANATTVQRDPTSPAARTTTDATSAGTPTRTPRRK